jgi:hypothetical protein
LIVTLLIGLSNEIQPGLVALKQVLRGADVARKDHEHVDSKGDSFGTLLTRLLVFPIHLPEYLQKEFVSQVLIDQPPALEDIGLDDVLDSALKHK